MVIGNGLIANRFKQKYIQSEKQIIFASGVSNSKNSSADEFKREVDLVLKTIAQNTTKQFVYFSTCSIYDPSEKNSSYVKHKVNIENIIASNQQKYIIFRVSNLVGHSEKKNSNTILNYLVDKIIHQENFELWQHAKRNFIDIDDMYAIVDDILTNQLVNNCIINIANPNTYAIKSIIETIENEFKLKAKHQQINKGGEFDIDINDIIPIIKKLNILFENDYFTNLLVKYYANFVK
jgi:nucleoside-diphosphate-sugar epimerase